MTITIDGIEYEETVTAANGGPVYEPVATTSSSTPTLTAVAAKSVPRSPSRLYQGDTLGPIYMPGQGSVSLTGGDWVCRSQVIDRSRSNVVTERTVTEITSIDGVDYFVAGLLPEESEQLVPPIITAPGKFWWSVEIESESLDYRRTIEVQLAVLAKP